MHRGTKFIKQSFVVLFLIMLTGISCDTSLPTLKDAFKDQFHVGAALNRNQIYGQDSNALLLVENHFSSITAENIMKWENIHPEPGEFNFEPADRFVEFGEKNNMFIVGHCLVWHNQTP
ncbi:MAG: endo-1,4-beta-xylanase, partial [Bacteroidales bacterium]|nr:endo-1,4-beta-xylanase [Bacteroidales bacterium]